MAFPTKTLCPRSVAWLRWLCETVCTLVSFILGFFALIAPLYPYSDLDEPLASKADSDIAAAIVFFSIPGIGLLLAAEMLSQWRSRKLSLDVPKGFRLALLTLFAWRLFQVLPYFEG